MDNTELTQFFTDLFNNNQQNHQYKGLPESKDNYSDCILVKVRTGGNSGGSCWGGSNYNDSKDQKEIISDLQQEIESTLFYSLSLAPLNLTKEALQDQAKIAAKANEYGEVSYDEEYEAYGNSSKYNFYAIPMQEVLGPLLTESQKSIFDKVHAEFMEKSNKAFQKNKIETAHTAMEEALKTFDKEKATQKSNMCKQLALIQAQLVDFDKNTYAQKTKMKKQLEDLTQQLAQFEPEIIVVQKKNKKK